MYLSHFGFDEPPFRITPNTVFFFDGANRGATLEGLLYAITHDEGIVKVTGEVGSGKTMLCRVLLERLPKNVETIYLANPSLSRDDILRAIIEDLGVDVSAKRTSLLLRILQDHLIERYAQGRRVVVLIDEAHAMPAETLEEIRLLSNLESSQHKLLQIVLFGQPELDEHLNLPNMRQLNERITHAFKLEPLLRADIESYVDFRMRAAGYRGRAAFSSGALRAIARASQGLTRRVNILSDKALLAAFADSSHEVTARHARAAIKDSGFRRLGRGLNPWWLAAGGLAAGVAIGIAAQFVPAKSLLMSGTIPAAARELHPAMDQTVRVTGGASAALVGQDGEAGASSTRSTPETRVEVFGPDAPATRSALPEAPSPADNSAASPSAPTSEALGEDATTPASSHGASTIAARNDGPNAGQNDKLVLANKSPSDSRSGDMLSAAAPVTNTRAGLQANGPGGTEKVLTPNLDRLGPLTRSRYLAAQRWIRSTPANHYSVLLLAAGNNEFGWLENFLQRAAQMVKPDELYVYSSTVNGREGFRLAYGTFGTLQEGREAVGQLPQPLRAYQPYAESLRVIRQLGGDVERGTP